jgi:hypothetical protein
MLGSDRTNRKNALRRGLLLHRQKYTGTPVDQIIVCFLCLRSIRGLERRSDRNRLHVAPLVDRSMQDLDYRLSGSRRTWCQCRLLAVTHLSAPCGFVSVSFVMVHLEKVSGKRETLSLFCKKASFFCFLRNSRIGKGQNALLGTRPDRKRLVREGASVIQARVQPAPPDQVFVCSFLLNHTAVQNQDPVNPR